MRYQSGATDTSVRKHCCWNGRSAAADLLEKGRAASMAMGRMRIYQDIFTCYEFIGILIFDCWV